MDNLPQYIYLALSFFGMMVAVRQHGTPKTGINSIWNTIFATGIVYGLLIWGGFFDGLLR